MLGRSFNLHSRFRAIESNVAKLASYRKLRNTVACVALAYHRETDETSLYQCAKRSTIRCLYCGPVQARMLAPGCIARALTR